jgi:hypothetical protein
MRLNRWQRGGIVISVVWAVVGGLWGLSAVHNPSTAERAFCDGLAQIYTRTPDYVRPSDAAPAQDAGCGQWKQYRVLMPLVFGLAPIPIAWLLVYGLVGVVRWLRRGFAAN